MWEWINTSFLINNIYFKLTYKGNKLTALMQFGKTTKASLLPTQNKYLLWTKWVAFPYSAFLVSCGKSIDQVDCLASWRLSGFSGFQDDGIQSFTDEVGRTASSFWCVFLDHKSFRLWIFNLHSCTEWKIRFDTLNFPYSMRSIILRF